MRRLAFVLLLFASTTAHATGQCDSAAVEQYEHFPDDLAAFAGGKLGLVRSTFPRMYLAVAYLYMTGGKLDAATQAEVVSLFQRRHFVDGPWPGILAWNAARAKLGKPAPEVTGWGEGMETCLDDAYATAVRTAARLAASLPHADFVAWRDAQDQVFSNCSNKTPAIPKPLPKSASAAARAERDYQIAAATMYAGHNAEAATLFTKIGKDTASPWSSWGDYLAARAILRDSMIAPASPEDPTGIRYTDEGMQKGRAILERIAGPKGIPERGKAARALLSLIRVRQAPVAHIALAASILKKGGEDYRNALADWVVALDQALNQALASDVALAYTGPDLEALRDRSDLTDWVLTFGDQETHTDGSPFSVWQGLPTAAHALERWEKTRSLPWLVAALAATSSEGAATKKLLAAAAKVPRSSAAYDTILFYTLRLTASRRSGRATRAQTLEAEITARQAEPRSSLRNHLLDLRLGMAASLDDALDYSMRHSVGEGDECGLPEDVYTKTRTQWSHPEIAPDVEHAIENGMALDRLGTLLDDPHAPELLRTRLRRMMWTRALVRGDGVLEAKLLPTIDEPTLAALRAATVPDERRLQAALFLLAAHEHLDPGALDGRLTCPGVPPVGDTPPLTTLVEQLIGRADRTARDHEVGAMKSGGSTFDIGVAWLIAWANAHPTDPRLPQIFYDLNGASRRMWGACQASKSSKAAYTTMHKLWPQHPLTKKVKYWF